MILLALCVAAGTTVPDGWGGGFDFRDPARDVANRRLYLAQPAVEFPRLGRLSYRVSVESDASATMRRWEAEAAGGVRFGPVG